MNDPPNLPGTIDPRRTRALVMTSRWTYDDTAQFVPQWMRGRIPQNAKQGGVLELYEGRQGQFVQNSPDGFYVWAQFPFDEGMLDVIVPTERVRIGAFWRSMDEQLSDLRIVNPQLHPWPHITGGSLLEKYIRSVLNGLRQQTDKLRTLGMSNDDLSAMFADVRFSFNVATILRGFTSGAKALLQDGNFDVDALTQLPVASLNWPRPGSKCIYVRIYTHQANHHRSAVYVGQCSNHVWERHLKHNLATSNHTPHYDIARRSPPEFRYMIPLLVWNPEVANTIPGAVVDMAEQAIILLFNSYHGFIRTSSSGPKKGWDARLINQYALANAVSEAARSESGWPDLAPIGCNSQSPIFGFGKGPSIHCFRQPSVAPGARGMTVYRVPRTFYGFSGGRCNPRSTLSYYAADGTQGQFDFYIPAVAIQKNNLPRSSFQAYLVFEIMHDGRPHDVPHLGCPSVGPFKHFGKAAALGVRVEWFDQASKKWLSIPLQYQTFVRHFVKGVAENDSTAALVPWRRTMDIIQYLEGITYTEPLNGFQPRLIAARTSIVELRVDFLQQTVQWVPRVGKQCPAPEIADFDYNCRLMDKLLKNTSTLVNPREPPPRSSDFWKATTFDAKGSALRHELKCDFCRYMEREYAKSCCERDVRIQDNHVCRYCSLLHRPCTFTALGKSLELWGENAPHLVLKKAQKQHRALSRFPTGPHRFLAFHMTIPRDVEAVEVEAPFEGVEGMNILLTEDVDVLEEEQNDSGDLEDMEDADA